MRIIILILKTNKNEKEKNSSYIKLDKNRNEEELPKNVLAYKEKMYKELKKERDKFKDKYAGRSDEVMHATAMNMAKRKYGYNS